MKPHVYIYGRFSPSVLIFAGLLAITPVLRAQSSLVNISGRLFVPSDGITCSFRIDGAASKSVLVRAGGALLASFGTSGALMDPRLTLTNATTGAVVATNDDWNQATNATQVSASLSRVGALPYPAGSKDPAILATLAPGAYTATITGASSTTGLVLFEFYDADTISTSTLGYLAIKGSGSILLGITLGGTGTRTLLVRAVGPGLGGVGTMVDPSLSLFAGSATVGSNNDWGGNAALAAIASQVGASALTVGSKDSALVATLNPGGYTAQASGVGSSTGIVQVEIFDAGPINTAPTITTAPQTQQVNLGDAATFAVKAAGSLPFTYQWQKNGAAISGANGATYTIPAAQASDAANYSVVVTNSTGAATSAVATLGVTAGKIVNLSVRTTLAAAQTLSVGFYANAPKSMLIRAVGPTLGAAPFGLPGTIADPKIDVYDGGGGRVDGNDDWSPSLVPVFTSVAAFPFANSSKDAALQRSISGATTMQITGTGPGLVLVETYDTSGTSAARLTNVSARNRVGTGDNILIAGIVIGGGPLRVLIRGVGPALGVAPFNLPGVLNDSKLEIYNGAGVKVIENDNWDPGMASTFASVAAFSLPNGSKDSALTVILQPGAYTAQLSGVGGVTGDAIIEVYELP